MAIASAGERVSDLDPGPDLTVEPVRDNDAAWRFLCEFAPPPWAITAIDPTKRENLVGLLIASMDDKGRKALFAFLDKWGDAERNIYFSVGTVIPGRFKNKASREDIERVTHFHADLDPRAGEDLDSERERIRQLLANPPEGVPQASWVIFSGGGYQPLWTLETPIEIGGDLAKAEDTALYNVRIAQLLHGDNVQDISRLMRLPGTINVPDEGKLKKGRTKQLARVVLAENGYL